MKHVFKRKFKIRDRLLKLWRSHDSPHEIALGVAVGVFIGITPFYGFHIILGTLVALITKRVNKIAIFLGMNISLPPTIPLITWAGYSIGGMLLGGAYPPLQLDAFRYFSYETFLNFFYALLVGSFILGIGLSILFYLVTFWFFKIRTKKSGLSAGAAVLLVCVKG